jgi:thiol-disulfide isomerase/thioredoxin
MSSRIFLAFFLCLLSFFLVAPAQDELKALSLSDAKTLDEVIAYLNNAIAQRDLLSLEPKKTSEVLAELLTPASDRLLAIGENGMAYRMKFSALLHQVRTEIEGIEQTVESFLKEAAVREETKEIVEQWQVQFLVTQTQIKGIEATERKFEAFFKELESKEKTEIRTAMLLMGRFFLFSEKAKKSDAASLNFDQFKSELKTWTNSAHVPFSEVVSLGFQVAHRLKFPAEQIAKELTAYIQSPQCTVPAPEKSERIAFVEKALKLAVGVDPKLYGRTLDNKEFDWNSLRGKYVLVKFTATWCGPCQMQIPGMIETYEKYRNKGLEIISVYVWERDSDPVASVKNYVAEKKLPWLILSEALTVKAGQPPYGDFYGIGGVPTFVLVDKEGKILPTDSDEWKAKLAEIFR